MDGFGTPINWTVQSAGAAITKNRIVYDDGSNTVVMSDTDQATTNTLAPLGVFLGNFLGGDAATDDTGLDVRRGEPIPVIAGTGGLTAGERFCAEYSGTAANQGRALGVDTSATPFQKGQYYCGEVLKGASAGDYALVRFAPGQFDAGYVSSPVAIATAGNATITAAQLLSVEVTRDTVDGARTDTTDTAANIIAEAAKYGLGVGDSFTLRVVNISDSSDAITLAAGSGVTPTNAGADLIISQNEAATLHFGITSASAVSLLVIKD